MLNLDRVTKCTFFVVVGSPCIEGGGGGGISFDMKVYGYIRGNLGLWP